MNIKLPSFLSLLCLFALTATICLSLGSQTSQTLSYVDAYASAGELASLTPIVHGSVLGASTSAISFYSPVNNQSLSSGVNYFTVQTNGFTPSTGYISLTAVSGISSYRTNMYTTSSINNGYTGGFNMSNGSYTITASSGSYSDSITVYVGAVTPTPSPTTVPTPTPTVVATPTPVPVISSFTASPTTITQGQYTTLYWSVSNATSLTINNNVGSVTGLYSDLVFPTTTTTYVLTATNGSGSVTSSVTVTVNPEPTPTPTPAIPSAPVITATNGNKQCSGSITPVVISWQQVAGALSYNVKRGNTNSGPFVTIASSITTTSYSDSYGQSAYYVVTALNNAGESMSSNVGFAGFAVPTCAPTPTPTSVPTPKPTVTPAPTPTPSSGIVFISPTNNQSVSGVTYITVMPSGFTPNSNGISLSLDGNTPKVMSVSGSTYVFGYNFNTNLQGAHTLTAAAVSTLGQSYANSITVYYGQAPLPTPTATPTVVPTPRPTVTPTPSPVVTPTPSPQPVVTPTPVPTALPTPIPTPTAAAGVPAISSFTSSSYYISQAPQQQATNPLLSWHVNGATSLSLSWNQCYESNCAPDEDNVSGLTSTSVNQPSTTTVYTLTASNSLGSSKASLTIAAASLTMNYFSFDPYSFLYNTLVGEAVGNINPIEIKFYVDKNFGTPGAVVAGTAIDDVNSVQSGFSFAMPNQYLDGKTHQVWAWAVDPADPTGGPDIEATLNSPASFSYYLNPQAPTITSAPSVMTVGQTVTVSGSGFDATSYAIFSGTQVNAVSTSASSLSFVVPNLPNGSDFLLISNSHGQSLPQSVSVVNPAITSCGTVISQPGNYVLSSNLTGFNDCIEILDTSNVNVNCQGYTINAYQGIAVQNVNGFSISNCVILESGGGGTPEPLGIGNSTNGLVSNNTFGEITSNTMYTVGVASGSSDVTLSNNIINAVVQESLSSHLYFTSNQVTSPVDGVGRIIASDFYLYQGSNNTFTNNTVNGRSEGTKCFLPNILQCSGADDGFVVDNEPNDAFISNTIYSVFDAGVEITGGSAHNYGDSLTGNMISAANAAFACYNYYNSPPIDTMPCSQ